VRNQLNRGFIPASIEKKALISKRFKHKQ